ncbi:MAG: sulfotransferase [Cyanobacteria bacterium J06554_1]
MTLNYQFKIICGLHRSGTTYTGNILSEHSSFQVLHEPCNPEWGIKGVQAAYPYLTSSTPKDNKTALLLNDILNFRRQWNHRPPQQLKPLTHLLYRLSGGQAGRTWSTLRLRNALNSLPPVICWKDPFTTFALEHLLSTYKAQAVCMIRHPGALWHSNRKLKWPFDIKVLLDQKQLIERYGTDIPDRHWQLATPDSPASIAILWKLMARLISQQEKSQKSLITVRHEDLCVQPTATAADICHHFGMNFQNRMHRYIANTSSEDKKESAQREAFSFERNSKQIINLWRDHVDKTEEHMIRDIIGDDLGRFYERW